jgi:ferric-dicitrate binding protein FerR (iron transport regulator)
VAHDVGTQFEVRLTDASLRVRVRTGLVELRGRARTTAVRGGAEVEVTVSSDTAVARRVPPFGPEWRWVAELAPAFDIEGRPLAAFLEHISREEGWTLRYEDAQIAGDARRIALHGSVNGLRHEDAVAVAVRTSGLAHRLRDGELLVLRPTERN